MPASAGCSSPATMPDRAAPAHSAQIGAQPSTSIRPIDIHTTKFDNSATSSTHERGNRSATTPPTSRKSTPAIAWKANTVDSVDAVAPGRSSTPKASATGVNAAASMLIVLAAHSAAKRRFFNRRRSSR